ncbi:hypothetical protein ScPMuIL_015054 [Solemya velum]
MSCFARSICIRCISTAASSDDTQGLEQYAVLGTAILVSASVFALFVGVVYIGSTNNKGESSVENSACDIQETGEIGTRINDSMPRKNATVSPSKTPLKSPDRSNRTAQVTPLLIKILTIEMPPGAMLSESEEEILW